MLEFKENINFTVKFPVIEGGFYCKETVKNFHESYFSFKQRIVLGEL